MKKVSIIIPSYNSWKTVGHTLMSLGRQTRRDLIAEVLVVDSSTDGKTREVLRNYESGWVRVIEAGRQVMPAIGRNIGAAQARGEILVFIDSDAYMADDWVERIVSCSEDGCLLGGGSVVLPGFQAQTPIAVAQNFLQFNEYMDVGPRRIKPFLPSCNMFCNKEVFVQSGGFPEIRASEDVVFFLKAAKIADVWLIPDAKVYHIFRESWSGFLNNQKLLGKYNIVYRRMMNKDRFYYKGFGSVLLAPVSALVKLQRMTRRVLFSRPSLALKYLAVFPLVLAGLFYWGLGFLEGAAGFSLFDSIGARLSGKTFSSLFLRGPLFEARRNVVARVWAPREKVFPDSSAESKSENPATHLGN